MKILVVGVFNDNSTNNGIANGFENAGHTVERFDYRHWGRILGSEKRDRQIFYFLVDRRDPEPYGVIVFCKCNGVSTDLIKSCRRYTKTFLWYMDPLNGNYNDELKEKIKVADYVGVAKWEVYLEAKKLNLNTHFLIEGFDPKWDYPIECEKKYDISFIGNPYGERTDILRNLSVFADIDIPILSDKYNIEHSKAVSQTKINLNFTGGGGPSDRVYKILAAGGFLLSEKYPHTEKYGLEPLRDFASFDVAKDMVFKIDYYLKFDDSRKKIARRGLQTVQKFSRDNLAKEIVDIVLA